MQERNAAGPQVKQFPLQVQFNGVFNGGVKVGKNARLGVPRHDGNNRPANIWFSRSRIRAVGKVSREHMKLNTLLIGTVRQYD